MIDLTDCKIDNLRTYDGANGTKIAVLYNGIRYMVKFPVHQQKNNDLDYTNSCISEHIASSIYRTFDIPTQETFLANYDGKMVVACKDFRDKSEQMVSFAMLKNSCINSINGGFSMEFSSIMEAIDTQQWFEPLKLKERFWDMFAADSVLGNFDRHNGNWGFLLNEDLGKVRLAPVYDNASSLYPQLTDEQIVTILKNKAEIENRIYVFPTSVIKIEGKKINYYDFLCSYEDENCLRSLEKVYVNFNSEKINRIIDAAPISDIRKEFYSKMIMERKEKILDVALDKGLEKKLQKGKILSEAEENILSNFRNIEVTEKNKVNELEHSL